MTKVLFLGDTHGSIPHCAKAAKVAKRMGADVIVQVGDWGMTWPEHPPRDRVKALSNALAQSGVPMVFIDGNHECFDELERRGATTDVGRFVELAPGVTYAPRGFAWEWDGVRFLSLGGAFSVDIDPDPFCRPPWPGRVLGHSYWLQETITYADVDRAITEGPVDIMITHDAPELPDELRWFMEKNHYKLDGASRSNRVAIRSVMDVVKPKLLVHGHIHHRYNDRLDDTVVCGLARDGDGRDSWVFIDTDKLDEHLKEVP